MRLVNLTPHPIDVYPAERPNLAGTDAPVLTVPPAQVPARVEAVLRTVAEVPIAGVLVPVRSRALGQVSGVPSPEPGVLYLVARVVKDALPDRDDVLVPDDLVRDADGRVIGCRALAR